MKTAITALTIFLSIHAMAETVPTVVNVEGMTCVSCATAIERSLKKFPEIASIKISINSEKVTLTYKDGKSLTPEQITRAIKEAGYKVKSIEGQKPAS